MSAVFGFENLVNTRSFSNTGLNFEYLKKKKEKLMANSHQEIAEGNISEYWKDSCGISSPRRPKQVKCCCVEFTAFAALQVYALQ